ncbi:MAG: helix-turn-helix transcriptional regulator [Angelakisella sp.]
MNIEIANRLVQYRKTRGMSQEELASALGISRQAVSKWERAEASPDTDNLISLAKLYGVSLDQLLLAEDVPSAQPAPAVTFDSEAPAASSIPPEELPLEEIPYYHTATSHWESLSPGAKMVVKLVGLAVAASLFIIYGLLSMVFYGLNDAYAVLCTAIYLIMGFLFDKWHPGWIIFLTIPVFYSLF